MPGEEVDARATEREVIDLQERDLDGRVSAASMRIDAAHGERTTVVWS